MTRDRDELELLLPFHANGTLEAGERAEVEAWLAEDREAAAEAAALAKVRGELQAEAVQSPGEFGLARLMRDVDRNAAPGAPAGVPQAANLVHRPWVWQAVAAVALAAFVGQWFLTGVGDGPAPRYELASAGDDGIAAVYTVAFVPTAAEGEIRELLVSLGLEIVAGPSSLGLYRLGGEADDAALAALRAAGDIVESVEHASD
jgi:anti-sigma factor RsiW